jgi:hypothetical protein
MFRGLLNWDTVGWLSDVDIWAMSEFGESSCGRC